MTGSKLHQERIIVCTELIPQCLLLDIAPAIVQVPNLHSSFTHTAKHSRTERGPANIIDAFLRKDYTADKVTFATTISSI